jgi:hypothetical protein
MIIPNFYEYRWRKTINCRKDYEDVQEKLDYLRFEYEIWALWIDKFYDGENGIYKTLAGGDAPRYVLEDDMDFCLWQNTYKKNYLKRNHFANHKVRSKYIIKTLKSLFKKVDKYVLRGSHEDEDEGFNLDFQEMKQKLLEDPIYKEKWFLAAYEANKYIDKLLNEIPS